MLQYTHEEWKILSEIAKGDDKVSKWLNCRLHEFCKEDFCIDDDCSDVALVVKPGDMVRKNYRIPRHLFPYINYLSHRFKQPPTTIVRRFITEPILLERLGVGKIIE